MKPLQQNAAVYQYDAAVQIGEERCLFLGYLVIKVGVGQGLENPVGKRRQGGQRDIVIRRYFLKRGRGIDCAPERDGNQGHKQQQTSYTCRHSSSRSGLGKPEVYQRLRGQFCSGLYQKKILIPANTPSSRLISPLWLSRSVLM